MIVLRVRGGLGNQLFQFAAGLALANHHQVPLKLDLYYFKKHPYRKFELPNLNVSFEVASREEVHSFTGSNPVLRFLNKRENYFHCPRVFSQPFYHYYEDFFSLPSPLYLNGYWQSEKYFKNITGEVRTIYSYEITDSRNVELIHSLADSQSVSVHVRRGDYTTAEYDSFFGGLTDAYYKRAISIIKEKVESPKFFVFSDNIDWCRKNLDVDNAVFVEHNRGADSFKDLFLMSKCKHNIIANSSFSWWGAWLNANPSKTVIAPEKWFQKTYLDKKDVIYPCRLYNTKDLIPPGWHRI